MNYNLKIKMIAQRLKLTYCYGYMPRERTYFKDCNLFSPEEKKYITISKVKLWYGKAKYENKYSNNDKIILGIQCEYINILTGAKIITEPHCGQFLNDNVEMKELELKNNDYIYKLFLNFDKGITYIKMVTKKGNILECGIDKEDTRKTIGINFEREPHMINSFLGYYNDFGLNALGFYYISRKDFILINILDIFRLKHLFKINEEEKKKWENPDEIKKLSLEMQAIVKLCNLENNLFNRIIQYYCSY